MLLVVGCPLAIFFLYQGGVKVAPFVWGLLCASSVLGIVLLVFGYRQRFPGGIPYVINITSNSIEFTHRDVANVSDNVIQIVPHRGRRQLVWTQVKEVAVIALSTDPLLLLELQDGTFEPIKLADLNQDPAVIAEIAINCFRNARGMSSMAAELGKRDLTTPCPICNIETDSLKSYEIGTIVFVFVAWFFRSKVETCCPRCMRGKIFDFLVTNGLTANVVWPFTVLPYGIVLLVSTFRTGHSKSVLKALALRMPPDSWIREQSNAAN